MEGYAEVYWRTLDTGATRRSVGFAVPWHSGVALYHTKHHDDKLEGELWIPASLFIAGFWLDTEGALVLPKSAAELQAEVCSET
jgi:hypothetical protein